MILQGACVVFRNRLLVAAQHVDSETLAGMQVSVRSCPVVDAYQNQRGLKGHRTKCIRRHAVDLAVLFDRDDRDTGGETSHRLTEIAGGKTHVLITRNQEYCTVRIANKSVETAQYGRLGYDRCQGRVEVPWNHAYADGTSAVRARGNGECTRADSPRSRLPAPAPERRRFAILADGGTSGTRLLQA